MEAEMRNHMRDAVTGFNGGRGGGSAAMGALTPNEYLAAEGKFMRSSGVDLPTLKSPQEVEDEPSKKSGGGKGKKSSAKKKQKKSKSEIKANSTEDELSAAYQSALVMPDKPKRPFSAYNLFFQLEREFIMHEISEGREPMDDRLIRDAMDNAKGEGGDKEELGSKKKKEGDDNNDEAKNEGEADNGTSDQAEKAKLSKKTGESQINAHPNINPHSQYFEDTNIPPRYSHLRLDKHWYSVGHKVKRKHRKTEGSCGFMALTKMVSARWKRIDTIDPHVKEYCQNLADVELQRYKRDMESYRRDVKVAERDAKTKALSEVEQRNAGMMSRMEGGEQVVVPPSVFVEGGGGRNNSGGKGSRKGGNKHRVEEGGGSKKKRAKRGNKREAEEIEFTPQIPKPQYYPEMFVGGSGPGGMMMGDMARLTDFSRLSSGRGGGGFGMGDGSSAFANSGMCGDIISTPLGGGGAGMVMHRGSGGSGASSGSSGLPAPPFADGRMAVDARARMAARMAEARLAGAPGGSGKGRNRTKDGEDGDKDVEDKSSLHTGDIKQKFAALAEAEARHRMQMEMQGSGGSMMGGRFGSSGSGGGRGGPSEFMSSYNGKPTFMGQGAFGGGGSSGSGGLTPLQRRQMMMEQFGAGGGGDMMNNSGSQSEQQFDMEVERFLSHLGKEIKENHRKTLISGGGGGGFGGGLGGSENLMAGMRGSMMGGSGGGGSAASSALQEQQMMMMGGGMPMGGMRAEMMRNMMLGRGGGSTANPEMMAEMMMMRNSIMGNSVGARRQQQRGSGGGGGDEDDPELPEYQFR
jgi:uncharacterized protein YutD